MVRVATQADARRMARIAERAAAYGVDIVEVAGWETRGGDWARTPVGILCHHDASSIKSGEVGSLGVVVAGRSDVPGPLAQFQVFRCLDGRPRAAIVAAGRANHAGAGGPLRVGATLVPQDQGNRYLYGYEAANDGISEPYSSASMRAQHAIARAVIDEIGAGVDAVFRHRDWAPKRKIDTKWLLTEFRTNVSDLTAQTEDDEMASLDEIRAIFREEFSRVATPWGNGALIREDGSPHVYLSGAPLLQYVPEQLLPHIQYRLSQAGRDPVVQVWAPGTLPVGGAVVPTAEHLAASMAGNPDVLAALAAASGAPSATAIINELYGRLAPDDETRRGA